MSPSDSDMSILLGRPFLKIAKAKIDVGSGSIQFEFKEDKISFDMPKSSKTSILSLNTVKPTWHDLFKLDIRRDSEMHPTHFLPDIIYPSTNLQVSSLETSGLKLKALNL